MRINSGSGPTINFCRGVNSVASIQYHILSYAECFYSSRILSGYKLQNLWNLILKCFCGFILIAASKQINKAVQIKIVSFKMIIVWVSTVRC
jgi:hypothetical protein